MQSRDFWSADSWFFACLTSAIPQLRENLCERFLSSPLETKGSSRKGHRETTVSYSLWFPVKNKLKTQL